MKKLGKQYGRLLGEDNATADLGAQIVANGGAYLKQVFSAFKNKAYQFNPEKIKGAKEFFKKEVIMKDESLRSLVDDLAKQQKRCSRVAKSFR